MSCYYGPTTACINSVSGCRRHARNSPGDPGPPSPACCLVALGRWLPQRVNQLPSSRYELGSLLVGFIISWVQYLGPPVPFSFPDSRDLLEVLRGLPWQRERGGVPRGSSRTLGDPPIAFLTVSGRRSTETVEPSRRPEKKKSIQLEDNM